MYDRSADMRLPGGTRPTIHRQLSAGKSRQSSKASASRRLERRRMFESRTGQSRTAAEQLRYTDPDVEYRRSRGLYHGLEFPLPLQSDRSQDKNLIPLKYLFIVERNHSSSLPQWLKPCKSSGRNQKPRAIATSHWRRSGQLSLAYDRLAFSESCPCDR
jgi:hypothetical protein